MSTAATSSEYQNLIQKWQFIKKILFQKTTSFTLQKATEIISECIRCQMFEEDSDIESVSGNWNQLSQPSDTLTHYELLKWLEERRGNGLWAQCDGPYCNKWRYLRNVHDPLDLPEKWYCYMNPDTRYNMCSVPEQLVSPYAAADMIYNKYTAGSVVWAKAIGCRWSLAMVCDCPDDLRYYLLEEDDVPTQYHVVFFGKVVYRAWVPVENLKSYKHEPDFDKQLKMTSYFARKMKEQKLLANDALRLNIKKRLEKYSFLAVWKKPILDPFDNDKLKSKLKKTINNKNKKNTKKGNTGKRQKKH